MKRNFWLWAYLLLLSLYTLYSYSQVDPNLVLSSKPFLWKIQQVAWALGYEHRLWSSVLYTLLVVGMVIVYSLILKKLQQREALANFNWKWVIAGVMVLSLSYPALSHDIFNYLFNAKMVWWYGANPHETVALNFPEDPWLWFTHNTHTTAPYYYGWTALSIVPSFLGQNQLKLTIFLFRLMMIGAFYVWLKGIAVVGGKRFELVALALNPLVLIEIVGNIHNDVVMMALLIWSLAYFIKGKQVSRLWWIPALVLFGLSVSIKYASVMVVAGAGLWWVANRFLKRISWGGAQVIAHFGPLLSTRSQRFLPWYLIWPLTFLPLSREKWLNQTLLLFTVTGLLSYIPFLLLGEYTPMMLSLRTVILFVPPLSYLLTQLILDKALKK